MIPTPLRISFLTTLVAVGALTVSASADSGSHTSAATRDAHCRAPRVTGLSLAAARRKLQRAGCKIVVRDRQPTGAHMSPLIPNPRQLVAAQSPTPGHTTRAVTISLKPLCPQSADPGPPPGEPIVKPGPTELISGLYLDGGPLRISPRCRAGVPSPGTITVTDPTSGRVIAEQKVASGHLATIALAPGSYSVVGTFADAQSNGRPIQTRPVSVAIQTGASVRLDLQAPIR